MNKFKNNKRRLSTVEAQAGFIKMIILVVAGLVLIKYAYNIDIVAFLTEGKFRDYLDKIYHIANLGWQKYSDTIMKAFNYCIALVKNIFSK